MRLVIETGAGLPDANSYISEKDAMDNLLSSLQEQWNGFTPDERIDRLITATQYLDLSFNWIGSQKSLEQGLCWPRTNVIYQGHTIPDNVVPKPIKRAVLMLLQLTFDYGIEIIKPSTETQVKKEKIGALETEYFAPSETITSYGTAFADINNLLAGFYSTLTKGSGVQTSDVVRA